MSLIAPKDLATSCARELYDKKAEDIVVLRVEALTTLANYFIIATGKNPRHLKALSDHICGFCEWRDKDILGTEGEPQSGWLLVDAGEVIVQLFDAERRDIYNLELLWGDAPRHDWQKNDA